MSTHMRHSCLIMTSHFNDKPTFGSEYQISTRFAKSSPLRSISSFPSSIFTFSSDPRHWHHVASGPQTTLSAVLNPQQPDNEDGGPTLNEEYSTRQSADEVRKEILDCYKLVDKLGRGAVYLGSARIEVDHAIYLKAKGLAQEVALLLNCTSWTGAGQGMMDAATQGAMQAKRPVGGFRISWESGSWSQSSVHPYLESATYLTSRFFSARKHGLVEAGVRNSVSDRTAFICLPGGIGTLDELFEILTLIQLDRIGSSFPVPFLVLNYEGFYTNLLRFMATCKEWGTVRDGEFEKLCRVCTSNLDALEYLADFYDIPEHDRLFRHRLQEF